MKTTIALILVGGLVSLGCAHYICPATRTRLRTDRIFDVNYQIGKKQVVYVGQPIAKVKYYMIDRYRAKHMHASDDFVISGGPATITGDCNTEYQIRGKTKIHGEVFTVVRIPHSLWEPGVLVKADGTVYNKVLNGNILVIYSFRASPPGLRFIPSEDEEINVEAGYLNYELVYAGIDGESIIITYREYTPKDFARPAFYLNLVYEVGQDQIRFRDTVIKIHEATNQQIVYTVIADGLSDFRR